jgi:uncharacterized RDD family membrane protein YckC
MSKPPRPPVPEHGDSRSARIIMAVGLVVSAAFTALWALLPPEGLPGWRYAPALTCAALVAWFGVLVSRRNLALAPALAGSLVVAVLARSRGSA